jgi:hypothetical protein
MKTMLLHRGLFLETWHAVIRLQGLSRRQFDLNFFSVSTRNVVAEDGAL